MLPSRGPSALILGAVVRAEAPLSVRPVSPPDAVRIRVIDGLSVEGPYPPEPLELRESKAAADIP